MCDSESGGALKGSTIAVHNTENAAKMSRASRPLTRSNGSLISSVKRELIRLRYVPGGRGDSVSGTLFQSTAARVSINPEDTK